MMLTPGVTVPSTFTRASFVGTPRFEKDEDFARAVVHLIGTHVERADHVGDAALYRDAAVLIACRIGENTVDFD